MRYGVKGKSSPRTSPSSPR